MDSLCNLQSATAVPNHLTNNSNNSRMMNPNFYQHETKPAVVPNFPSIQQLRSTQLRNNKGIFLPPSHSAAQVRGSHFRPQVQKVQEGLQSRDWNMRMDALRQWRNLTPQQQQHLLKQRDQQRHSGWKREQETTPDSSIREGLKAEIHWRRFGVWKRVTFGRYEPTLRMWQVMYGNGHFLNEWIDPALETLRPLRGSKRGLPTNFPSYNNLSTAQQSSRVNMPDINKNTEVHMKNIAAPMNPIEHLPVDSKPTEMLRLNRTHPRPQPPHFLFATDQNKERCYPLPKSGMLPNQNYSTLNSLAWAPTEETAKSPNFDFPTQNDTVKITKKKSSAKPKKRKRRARPQNSTSKKKPSRKKKKENVKIEKNKATQSKTEKYIWADSNPSDSPPKSSGRVTTPAPTSLHSEQSKATTPPILFDIGKLPPEPKLPVTTEPIQLNHTKYGNLERMFPGSGSKVFDDPFGFNDCLMNQMTEHDSVYSGSASKIHSL